MFAISCNCVIPAIQNCPVIVNTYKMADGFKSMRGHGAHAAAPLIKQSTRHLAQHAHRASKNVVDANNAAVVPTKISRTVSQYKNVT